MSGEIYIIHREKGKGQIRAVEPALLVLENYPKQA
jgi:hypothetical protein